MNIYIKKALISLKTINLIINIRLHSIEGIYTGDFIPQQQIIDNLIRIELMLRYLFSFLNHYFEKNVYNISTKMWAPLI